ncbi:hypothetical protein IKF84_01480 [Candidatus Saccharibacteria bacterium]|nr:hypothetical protein [Candidatus Saccharibacteria bacterium]
MYVSSFSPVLGGLYGNSTLNSESTRGFWWGSDKYDGAIRYVLYYNGDSLLIGSNSRRSGNYIRCIQAS